MRLAESVTFGGSAMDRAAHLRGDDAALAEAIGKPNAQSIVIWRSKPLFDGAEKDRLARIVMTHPLVTSSIVPPIFLGLEDGTPVFAHDVSDWQPEEFDREAMGSFVDLTQQVHPDGPEGAAFCELRTRMVAISPRDAELSLIHI